MPSRIELALTIATAMHVGQVDKGGRPYILHPIWVMCQMPEDDEDAQVVAICHDLIEDTELTLEGLHGRGVLFTPTVIAAIDAITRRTGEGYSEYIERVAQNLLATRVKSADLSHNMQMNRLPQPLSQADFDRQNKYLAAKARLVSGAWPSMPVQKEIGGV
jgi:(p)ppGpp synthase/HD superfamily hydrolase